MEQLNFMHFVSASVWADYARFQATLRQELEIDGRYDHEAEDYEADRCEMMVDDMSEAWGF